MKPKSDPIRDRYLTDLRTWLTPELLYHCFTGESNPEELERIAKLEHVLQQSLLDRVARLWPDRLEQIAAKRRRTKQDSKEAVEQYVLNIQR